MEDFCSADATKAPLDSNDVREVIDNHEAYVRSLETAVENLKKYEETYVEVSNFLADMLGGDYPDHKDADGLGDGMIAAIQKLLEVSC